MYAGGHRTFSKCATGGAPVRDTAPSNFMNDSTAALCPGVSECRLRLETLTAAYERTLKVAKALALVKFIPSSSVVVVFKWWAHAMQPIPFHTPEVLIFSCTHELFKCMAFSKLQLPTFTPHDLGSIMNRFIHLPPKRLNEQCP